MYPPQKVSKDRWTTPVRTMSRVDVGIGHSRFYILRTNCTFHEIKMLDPFTETWKSK